MAPPSTIFVSPDKRGHLLPVPIHKTLSRCNCSRLTSLQTDPSIQLTARTLPDGESSKRILARNGFTCHGTIHDDEDGEVLGWKLTDITHLPQP